VNIIRRALEEPLRTLANNAGVEGSVVVMEVKKTAKDSGYNVDKDEYVDMFAAGIIDPTKVTRTALQNAASIAGLLLTTECVVVERKEEKPAPAAPGGGGMGGMY
jgi:chaperonin GroEL